MQLCMQLCILQSCVPQYHIPLHPLIQCSAALNQEIRHTCQLLKKRLATMVHCKSILQETCIAQSMLKPSCRSHALQNPLAGGMHCKSILQETCTAKPSCRRHALQETCTAKPSCRRHALQKPLAGDMHCKTLSQETCTAKASCRRHALQKRFA
jgi:hypothetical protein